MKNIIALCGMVILVGMLSSCGRSDLFIGKWFELGTDSNIPDFEIKKSANGYLIQDTKGEFESKKDEETLIFPRLITRIHMETITGPFFCAARYEFFFGTTMMCISEKTLKSSSDSRVYHFESRY